MKPQTQYEKLKNRIFKQAEKLIPDEQKKEILHNRLSSLSKAQMKLIQFIFFDDLSYRQIAKKMRISHVSVFHRWKKIEDKLRKR